MACMLHPTIQEVLVQQLASDPWVLNALDRTCKAFRDQIQTTNACAEIQAWLVARTGLDREVYGEHEIFTYCNISAGSTSRVWHLKARLGRRSFRLFYTTGLIAVHKNCCSMTLLGDDGNRAFKDSFRRIPDLPTLFSCMAVHGILCHQLPQNLSPVSEQVRHRHRDTVPWTCRRALFVWWASVPKHADRKRPSPAGSILILRGASTASGNITISAQEIEY
jgi:hypothetical protein